MSSVGTLLASARLTAAISHVLGRISAQRHSRKAVLSQAAQHRAQLHISSEDVREAHQPCTRVSKSSHTPVQIALASCVFRLPPCFHPPMWATPTGACRFLERCAQLWCSLVLQVGCRAVYLAPQAALQRSVRGELCTGVAHARGSLTHLLRWHSFFSQVSRRSQRGARGRTIARQVRALTCSPAPVAVLRRLRSLRCVANPQCIEYQKVQVAARVATSPERPMSTPKPVNVQLDEGGSALPDLLRSCLCWILLHRLPME